MSDLDPQVTSIAFRFGVKSISRCLEFNVFLAINYAIDRMTANTVGAKRRLRQRFNQ
ncbi:hypothetical protein [Chamaesiphon sp. VAR_48_metabat_403]|uniref:hypothetical protein n=1 Tax=Chamaesiphon sp. VAR_48_metabat_403 TaxID=2964700 RepID=UPI00286E16B8|nr:hypothetical protein [Chamaesiphon sp. VAR_48_metabat_403]